MYPTRAMRMFQPTRAMMRPVPNEEQAEGAGPSQPVPGTTLTVPDNITAHTVSQRLRRLRKIPAELIPLGVVVGFAVFAAAYSCTRHLMVDKTIRLKRQNRAADGAAHEGSEEHH